MNAKTECISTELVLEEMISEVWQWLFVAVQTNNKGHYNIPSAGFLKMKRNIESIIKESRFLLCVDSKALEHHLFV